MPTNAILIVAVADSRHIQMLVCIQLLLLLQDPIIEELLQLLVRVVDAKLLERIRLEELL